MNEITQLLAKPLPLGLMVVFFLVALAVFSLFLARIESRHRSQLIHYQDQLRAVHQGAAASSSATWAGAQPVALDSARSGSWVGWLLSVGAVIGVGVALLWTQLPGTASLVVPELARLPGLGAEPSVVMVEPPAVAPPVETVEPKAPVQAALVPSGAAAKAAPQPSGSEKAPAPRRAGFQDDAEIERMLAWERRRAAQRNRLRGKQPARSGQGQPRRRVQEQRQAASPTLPSVAPRAEAKQGQVDRAPAQKPKPAAQQPPSTPEVVDSAPALAQEPTPPRKRRKRLKLDQSGDPMGNI